MDVEGTGFSVYLLDVASHDTLNHIHRESIDALIINFATAWFVICKLVHWEYFYISLVQAETNTINEHR